MGKTLKERVKRCCECNHFVFDDDDITYCMSCFVSFPPKEKCEEEIDPELYIITPEEIKDLPKMNYFLSFLFW